jgi:hypothetical protein
MLCQKRPSVRNKLDLADARQVRVLKKSALTFRVNT